nr:hypothetical protein [Tanacetum cinerariifolium]
MRTRSQSREKFPRKEASPAIVEPLHIKNPFLEDQFQEDPSKDPPKVLMTDNKTMAEMLRAPTEGSEIAKLTHAVNEQTSAMTTAMMAMLGEFQATPPPASVKDVEETCVTCEGAHLYYQCLAAGGKTFLEFRDNIQEYGSAAAANYN